MDQLLKERNVYTSKKRSRNVYFMIKKCLLNLMIKNVYWIFADKNDQKINYSTNN
jgi:hypothetical protein